MNNVTFLQSTFKAASFETLPLQAALQKIKDGTYKDIIDEFRGFDDPKERKAKKPMLPSFSFNGSFHDAVVNTNFLESSGLFHFDIDGLDDVDKHKQIISSIPTIVFCFVSTSGTGLKGAVKIDKSLVKNDADFKVVFKHFESFFKRHGYEIDKACKDVRRLCFVSHDPDIYINYDADTAIVESIPLTHKSIASNDNHQSDNHLDRVLNILKQASPGNRHDARLRAGRLAGGYIATGFLNEAQTLAALLRMSDSIADNGVTTTTERKTIIDGIEMGKESPLMLSRPVIQQVPKQLPALKWKVPKHRIIPNDVIMPFNGVMEAVVKQVLHIANKPQPELTILSALIGMASAIGGNYKLNDGTRLNLYGIGISSTGTGKDKAMLAGTSLALMAGATTGGQPGSGAALEDSLNENGTKLLLEIDEAAHFIAAMNDQKQTHMASLSGNLLKLFSASRSKYVTRKLANSSGNEQKVCITPCVSMLGFACPEKLGAAFGSGNNIDDGLMGRILFANGRENVKPLRGRAELHFDQEISAIASLINCSHDITIKFDDEADSRLDFLIDFFDTESMTSTNPFAKNLKTRSFEKCLKVAAVLSVWDCPQKPVITGNHVNWAESFIKYSDDAVLKFTEANFHGGLVQTNADKIMKIVGKINRGELKPHVSYNNSILDKNVIPKSFALRNSHLSKKDFDDAINHLADLEKVVQRDVMVGEGITKVLYFK